MTLLGMFAKGWTVQLLIAANYGKAVLIRGTAVHEFYEPITREGLVEIPWATELRGRNAHEVAADVDTALASAFLRIIEELRHATDHPFQRQERIAPAPHEIEP